MAIFTTLITPTELANISIKFQAGGCIFALWRRVAPSLLQPLRGRDFWTVLFLFFFDIFGCCAAPQGPMCVSCVSVDDVGRWWCSGGPFCESREAGSVPPSACCVRRGGEGGSGVLVCESTCVPDGPKMYRPSV